MTAEHMLWIVGKWMGPAEDQWEFIGVFSEELAAVIACLSAKYFVGPVHLNEAFPDQAIPWPGLYYPKR